MLYRQRGQATRSLTTLHHLLETYPPGEEPQSVLMLEGLTLLDLGRPQQAAAKPAGGGSSRASRTPKCYYLPGPGLFGRRPARRRPPPPPSRPWRSMPRTSPAGNFWHNWPHARLPLAEPSQRR